jgi:hypothetical protein
LGLTNVSFDQAFHIYISARLLLQIFVTGQLSFSTWIVSGSALAVGAFWKCRRLASRNDLPNLKNFATLIFLQEMLDFVQKTD